MSVKLLELIADLTGKDRTVTFPKAYVEWLKGDYVAAVVLNEVVWWTRISYDKGREGWFYRSEVEWLEEKGLSRKQVVRSVTAINATAGTIPLIERMTKRANGSPTMHFRLNASVFADLVEGEWKLPKGQKPTFPNGSFHSAQTAESLTESTTEKTTETFGASATTPTATPTSKRATQVASDWALNESLRAWCAGKGYGDHDVAREAEKFVNHYTATGGVFKDWSAAFRTWMGKAESYGHIKPARQAMNPSARVDSMGRPLPTAEEQADLHRRHIEGISAPWKP